MNGARGILRRREFISGGAGLAATLTAAGHADGKALRKNAEASSIARRTVGVTSIEQVTFLCVVRGALASGRGGDGQC